MKEIEKLKKELKENREEIVFLRKLVKSLGDDVKSANEQACYYMCERNKLIHDIEELRDSLEV